MDFDKVIFLDTETTGINFVDNELIQVAAITCDLNTTDMGILSSINYYFEAAKEVNSEAARVNGYYKGKWESEGLFPIEPKIGAGYVIKYLTQPNTCIFCHNSSFDRAFISIFLTRNGIPPEQQPKYFFDSATLAALFKFKSDWEKVSLNYCATQLGVQYRRLKKHDGLDDCYFLREVFVAMMKRISVN
jgi:DNA polymerase III epsilon subunit-like protein